MSSYRHMFHRNLRGLPDHPPAFPATLVTESGNTSECTHMKTNEAGHLISPLFTQEQEVSANPFGVSVFQQEAASGRQQQPASSSVVISEVCHCLNMTEKECCLKGRISTNILEKKQLHELFKVNVQLREDYLRLKWRWLEKVAKGENLILLQTKPINNLCHKDWSCIRRIIGLIKLNRKTVDD